MAVPKIKREVPKRDSLEEHVVSYVASVVDAKDATYRNIELSDIICNPNNDYNEYDTEDNIQALADDIERNGLLHNIVLSNRDDGPYVLLSGERRYKAYCLLNKKYPNENKYSKIFSQIRFNLTGDEEALLIDAANLMARGGAENEYKRRTASIRFVKRLEEKFNITEKDALRITMEYSQISQKTLQGNVAIENNLIEPLKEYLNKGFLAKENAIVFASHNSAEQEVIYNLIKSAASVDDNKEIIKAGNDISSLLLENKQIEKAIEKQLQLIEMQKQSIETADNEEEKQMLENELSSYKNELKNLQTSLNVIEEPKSIKKFEIPIEEKVKKNTNRKLETLKKNADYLLKDGVFNSYNNDELKTAEETIKNTISALKSILDVIG